MASANNLIPHVASLGINGLNGFESSANGLNGFDSSANGSNGFDNGTNEFNGFDSGTNGLNGFDNETSPTGDSWLSDQSKVTPTNTYPSRCYSALIPPARADPNPPHHSPG
jgi:hypothetical protein